MKAEDAERARAWRNAHGTDREVIAVNTTFRMAPWADALYAMDKAWWNLHREEILANFKGKKFSSAAQDNKLDVQVLGRPDFEHFSNSGAGAVNLAMSRGATKIFLLGYDCQHVNGQTHWHGNHPKPLTNLGSLERWRKFFDRLARHAQLRGVTVSNCSRITALTCFPRVSIDDVLPMTVAEAA